MYGAKVDNGNENVTYQRYNGVKMMYSIGEKQNKRRMRSSPQ
jgi:hypothetical protein